MRRMWFLCDDCMKKSEKLKRGLTDDEMCDDCLLNGEV